MKNLDTFINAYMLERLNFDDTTLGFINLHKTWINLMKHLQCEVIDDDEYNSTIYIKCTKHTVQEFNKQMDSLDDFICVKIRNIYYILEVPIFNRLKTMDIIQHLQQEIIQYASILTIKVRVM